MKKRNFLKTSAILATGSLLTSNFACNMDKPVNERIEPNQEPLQNWAKNLTYGTNKVDYPNSIEAIQNVVKKATKLKGLGSRHSFNTIADSQHLQVCPSEMKGKMKLDEAAKTVT